MKFVFAVAMAFILIAPELISPSRVACACQVPGDGPINKDVKGTSFEAIAQHTSFMPAPREVLRPLIRAERALREGETRRAAELLGGILSVSNSEDYLVLKPGKKTLAVSLRSRAMELMSQLPDSELESYQLRYGVTANKQLEASINTGDFAAIAKISRQYFFTEAGYMAAMMMGYHHFEKGQVVAAASAFRKVYDFPAARKLHDPSLSVMLATCWVLAGEEAKAKSVLLALKRQYPNERIKFLGKAIALFADDQDAVVWLRSMIGSSSLRSNRLVNEWVIYRGNPQRNGYSEPGFPLPNARWSVPTLNDLDREKIIQERQEELTLLNASTIPAVQPIAVGDTIVMRSFDKLIGVSFQTGKRVWVFPPWDTDMVYTDEEIVHQSFTQFEKLNRGPLWQRMYEDAVYGQVSSDGQSIFVVPYPGIAGGEKLKMVVDKGVILDDPMGQRNYNELISIDIQREGAFLWEVGGSTGHDEPKLAKALFLGPPLPLGDSLYAICHQNGEVRLVVLDPKNGRLRWSQQLASLERKAKGDVMRLAGATPSYSDGVLVCPTGVGALVGVDIATQSLLWGYQYSVGSELTRVTPVGTRSESAGTMEGFWRDSTITIRGNTVVYTPVEKQSIVCVDLFTGSPLWLTEVAGAATRTRGNSLYVATVTEKKIVLVGLDSVRAINRQSGDAIWKTSLENFGAPSGRGYSDGSSYFLPTTGQRLVRIDLQDGRITGDVETSRVLGNLICFRGEVISHGVDHLATYPLDEPNRRIVEAAEATGMLTPGQETMKAQLLLQRGDILSAVESISSAYQQEPTVTRRDILLDSILRLFEFDFEKGEKYAGKYSDLLNEFRSQEFVAARVVGLIKESKFTLAFDCLVSLLGSNDEFLATETVPLSFRQNTGNEDNSPVHMSKDRWFHLSLESIFKSIDEPTRKRFREQLSGWFHLLPGMTVERRHDLFRRIGPQFFLPNVQLELARALIDENMILRRASILQDYCQRYGNVDGLNSAAFAEYLQLLAANSIDAHVACESRRFDDLLSQLTEEQTELFQSRTPALPINRFQQEKFGLADDWLVNVYDDGTSYLHRCRLLPKNVPDFFSQFGFYFYSHTGEIEVVNAVGKPIHRFNARSKSEKQGPLIDQNTVGQIQVFENVVLVNIGSELFALNWFRMISDRDPVLWSLDLGPDNYRAPPVQRESVWGEYRRNERTTAIHIEVGAPGPMGVCFKKDNRLICVDLFTGQTVWQKTHTSPTLQLFGDEGNVVSWDTENRHLTVYEMSSGKIVVNRNSEINAEEFVATIGSKVLLTRKQESSQASDNDPIADNEPSVIPPGLHLSLYDPVNGDVVWTKSYMLGTVASQLPRRRMAFLKPDSEFEILNLEDGSTELATTLDLTIEQRVNVSRINVREILNGFMIVMSTAKLNNSIVRLREDRIDIRRFNYSQLLWEGYLTVIDKRTAKPRWNRPARIDHFQFSDYQPYDAPAILLGRLIDRRMERSGPQRFVQLMFVDVYSGRLIAWQDVPVNDFVIHKIEGDPLRNQMKVSFYDKQLLVQFENAEVPPAPVANLTLGNTAYPKLTDVGTDSTTVADNEAELQKLKNAVLTERADLEKRIAEIKKLIQQQRNASPQPSPAKYP